MATGYYKTLYLHYVRDTLKPEVVTKLSKCKLLLAPRDIPSGIPVFNAANLYKYRIHIKLLG